MSISPNSLSGDTRRNIIGPKISRTLLEKESVSIEKRQSIEESCRLGFFTFDLNLRNTRMK